MWGEQEGCVLPRGCNVCGLLHGWTPSLGGGRSRPPPIPPGSTHTAAPFPRARRGSGSPSRRHSAPGAPRPAPSCSAPAPASASASHSTQAQGTRPPVAIGAPGRSEGSTWGARASGEEQRLPRPGPGGVATATDRAPPAAASLGRALRRLSLAPRTGFLPKAARVRRCAGPVCAAFCRAARATGGCNGGARNRPCCRGTERAKCFGTTGWSWETLSHLLGFWTADR